MSDLDTFYGVLHPERQESFDNLVNGLACHYERLGKGVTGSHAADKYTLEYAAKQLESLMAAHIAQAEAKAAREGERTGYEWLKAYIKQQRNTVTLVNIENVLDSQLAALSTPKDSEEEAR
jgi:hypothetical protein